MWKKAWQHNKHSENLLSHVDGFFSDWFVVRLAAFQGQIHLCLPSPPPPPAAAAAHVKRTETTTGDGCLDLPLVNIRHVACALFSDSRGIRRLPHNRPRHSNKWERAPRVDTTQPGHVRRRKNKTHPDLALGCLAEIFLLLSASLTTAL